MATFESITEKDRYGFDSLIPANINPSIKRCYSPNAYAFFRKTDNRSHCRVIRHNGYLWFAMIFTGNQQQDYWNKPWDEWVGVRVCEVATRGVKAELGWHTSQGTLGFEDVTDWFWAKYLSEGMYGIYEVWHRSYPQQKTHREHSQV